MGRDPSVFLHECALCESDDVGPRTRVWAFAHIMRGARVGADCNIGEHAFVESGATLGNRVTVKNAVLIWEKVTIEDEVFLGPLRALLGQSAKPSEVEAAVRDQTQGLSIVCGNPEEPDRGVVPVSPKDPDFL